MSKNRKPSDLYAPQAKSWIFWPSVRKIGVPAGVVLIAIAVFIVYLPCITGRFILDDNVLVTKNRLVTGSNGLYRFWSTNQAMDYWPATNSTFWLEWRLWGMGPNGYHVTNLVLHALEALLIWIILRKLSIPGAFLAAMIFAVHPVNVESVAWIAQRKETMAMLFFLLSILWYVKFLELTARPISGRCMLATKQFQCPQPTRCCYRWYFLSLTAFVLAMLSKGSAAILPVLLLGIIWWLRPLRKGDIVRLAPFLAVAAALATVDVWFQTHGSGEQVLNADGLQRLLGAGGVVWFYVYKAFLPLNLVFIYRQWQIHVDNLWWWIPLVACVLVTALFWRYRNNWARPLLLAWGFFCVALVPAMGFVNVGFMKHSLVADHYQHISLIGAISLAAAGWGIWHRRQEGSYSFMAKAAAVLTVCALAVLTWRQSGLYDGPLTLYPSVLQNNPACWMAHNKLGVSLSDVGRTKEAIVQFEQALKLDPRDFASHSNLGNTLVQLGRNNEAIEHCEQAIRLNPDFEEAYNNLGNALVQKGHLEEGIKQYESAIRLDPDYVIAHCNLGNALLRAGRLGEAVDHFKMALSLKPGFAEIHNNLGSALMQQGQTQEAAEHFRQAIEIKPDYANAYYNLGTSFEAMGEYQKAADEYERALALKPDDPQANYNLGNDLAHIGRPERAIDHYRQAIRLKPEFIDACVNLALTCAGVHRSSEAIAAAQRAVDLARSQGQAERAGQIENWLNSYRASLEDPVNAPHSQAAGSPSP